MSKSEWIGRRKRETRKGTYSKGRTYRFSSVSGRHIWVDQMVVCLGHVFQDWMDGHLFESGLSIQMDDALRDIKMRNLHLHLHRRMARGEKEHRAFRYLQVIAKKKEERIYETKSIEKTRGTELNQ